jgi:hypothetical protein
MLAREIVGELADEAEEFLRRSKWDNSVSART